MAYAIGEKALFLHIPKTGGKAVLKALQSARLTPRPCRTPTAHVGHAREEELRETRYRWSFRFAFVRHPVRWYESLWKFASAPGSKLWELDGSVDHPFDPIMPAMRLCRDCDLNSFVEKILQCKPTFFGDMIRDYVGTIQKPKVEYVGRQEHLEHDLAEAIKLSGLVARRSIKLRPVNVSRPEKPVVAWDRDLVRAILEIEDKTISRFYGLGEYNGRTS